MNEPFQEINLTPGTAVGAGLIDAHAGALGVGQTRQGVTKSFEFHHTRAPKR